MALVGWQLPSAAMALAIAGIAAVLVLQVRRAVRHLKSQSHVAREAAAEAERHYVEVLRKIVTVVEGRDKYSSGHSSNVGDLAGRIARQMHLPEPQCARLVLAGQLHDIGLLAVPSEVIASRSRFGVEESRSIQQHSHVSYEVLRPLEMLSEVLPAIRSHHERMNGTGYPAGLAGRAIPLGGRILAVADTYDAMTHDRPHRQATSPLKAMRELRRCCPGGYDPDCVEALAHVLNIPAMEEAVTAHQVVCAP
jgi:HD-GYP domain-containing protein (c-di-GMP phosphodiesterase class II)